MRSPSPRLISRAFACLLFALVLVPAVAPAAESAAAADPAPPAGKPSAVVVLVGEAKLSTKEIQSLLDAAVAELRASSGYELDALKSLNAGSEVGTLGCALEYDCLLRVAESAEVDAVLGVRADVDGRKLNLALLWVAADARGLPEESASRIARTPRAIEAAVRKGVAKIIPDYARAGMGGLTVLAESGANILIDGQVVGTAPMEKAVVLSAGVHRVDVITTHDASVHKNVEVLEARRQTADLPSPTEAVAALTEAPAPVPGRALKTASFVVGGAGVLAFTGGMVFGLQASGINTRLRDGACQDTPCTAGLTQVEADRLYRQGNSQATIGNVGVATGVFLLAGAGVMYFLAHQDEQAAEAAATTNTATVEATP